MSKVKHHLTCVNIKRDETISIVRYYPYCVNDIFAYSHIDDNDDFHGAMYFRWDIWLRFSFTRNEQQSLYTLWNQWHWGYWPDMQYYTDMNYVENMKCDYYLEDAFNKKISSIETNYNVDMISSPATPTVYLEQTPENFLSHNVTLSMPSPFKKSLYLR